MLFVCPKCALSLSEGSGCAVCPSGHSYDKSKYGYYNLLISNAGGVHGDNKEMVDARRAFLDKGYYTPLAEEITRLVLKYTDKNCRLLDAGCGEGYYTKVISDAIYARYTEAEIIGFDISKEAVRKMKRRLPSAEAAVASCYSMPLATNTLDAVINIFSPLAPKETLRVLKSGGKFIVAAPDESHLFALKKLLYPTPYKNEVSLTPPEGFRQLERCRVTYTMNLKGREDIKNLFMMTPYAYRTPKSGRDKILECEELDCEADFSVFVYEKP